MFGAPVSSSGLTLGKVLGGISKALGVANQIIPLYKEAKPMINNAKTIISALKAINPTSLSNNSNIAPELTEAKVNKKQNVASSINDTNPIFFQ